MSIVTFHHDDGPDPNALLRWVLAAVLVVAVHGGLVALVNAWKTAEPPAGEPAPVMMIDLMPAGAPDIASEDADPGPQAEEAPPMEDLPEMEEAPPVEDVQPEPEPEPEVVPEPVPEPEPIPEPLPPEPEPEPIEPEIVETPPVPDPAVTLPPPPPPRPVIAEKPKPEPKPKAEARPRPVKQEKPRAQPRRNVERPPAQRTTAPQSSRGQPGPRSAAPSSGGAANLSAAPASWRSSLMAHINRHKRYPPAARQRGEEGVARVRFEIDRNGNVLSFRLLSGTGFPLLDEDAHAWIRRASPFPRIPDSVPGNRIPITVPLRFHLR
ncbi:energy transducer TonB [Pseudochelatococcus sp. B33]